MASNELASSKLDIIQEWFNQRNWQPFQFQKDCWQAYLNGESGLLNAPTGSGKTYAGNNTYLGLSLQTQVVLGVRAGPV